MSTHKVYYGSWVDPFYRSEGEQIWEAAHRYAEENDLNLRTNKGNEQFDTELIRLIDVRLNALKSQHHEEVDKLRTKQGNLEQQIKGLKDEKERNTPKWKVDVQSLYRVDVELRYKGKFASRRISTLENWFPKPVTVANVAKVKESLINEIEDKLILEAQAKSLEESLT
jgi:MoaA/NifB/PqqE/SkfB family radical SAM enzyme